MKITAPYFAKKPKDYYTADVKLQQSTDSLSCGTQKTAQIVFNGSIIATLSVDERGLTRCRFHDALDYVAFDNNVVVRPVIDGDLSYMKMDVKL